MPRTLLATPLLLAALACAYLHGRHVERWACIVEASHVQPIEGPEASAYWAAFDSRD